MEKTLIEWYKNNIKKFKKEMSNGNYELSKTIPFRYGILCEEQVSLIACITVNKNSKTATNKLVMVKENISNTISCIHIGRSVSNKEYEKIKKEKSNNLIRERIKSSEGNPLTLDEVSPIEQFIGLVSYADGITEFGAENVLDAMYDGDTKSKPIGFNDMFQKQFLESMNVVIPDKIEKVIENSIKILLKEDYGTNWFFERFEILNESYNLEKLSKNNKYFRMLILEFLEKKGKYKHYNICKKSYELYDKLNDTINEFERMTHRIVKPTNIVEKKTDPPFGVNSIWLGTTKNFNYVFIEKDDYEKMVKGYIIKSIINDTIKIDDLFKSDIVKYFSEIGNINRNKIYDEFYHLIEEKNNSNNTLFNSDNNDNQIDEFINKIYQDRIILFVNKIGLNKIFKSLGKDEFNSAIAWSEYQLKFKYAPSYIIGNYKVIFKGTLDFNHSKIGNLFSNIFR